MKETNNTGLKVVTIIFVIIALALAGYIVWDNVKNPDIPDETGESSSVRSETETETTTMSNFCHFNPNRGINAQDGVKYEIIRTLNIENVTLQLVFNENKDVVVQVYEGDEKQALDSDDSYVKGMKREIGKPEIIKGFSCGVDEIELGTIGQDINGSVILFLMENGTVEYIGLRDLMQTDNLSSRGKMPELKNIVRLESVDASSSEAGWATTVAIDTNGDFYDIGNIIYEHRIDTDKVY